MVLVVIMCLKKLKRYMEKRGTRVFISALILLFMGLALVVAHNFLEAYRILSIITFIAALVFVWPFVIFLLISESVASAGAVKLMIIIGIVLNLVYFVFAADLIAVMREKEF